MNSAWSASGTGTSISQPADPVIPERSAAESAVAWGDPPEDPEGADPRLTEDRPPHHDQGW